MSKTETRIQHNILAHRRRKAWQRFVRMLACVVIFCTTYALILPAITLENGEQQTQNVGDSLGTSHGTIINLFDYWITEQDYADNDWNKDTMLEQGINLGHALKFSAGDPYGKEEAHFNKWTGHGGAIYPGIVANRLGDDGYPHLNQAVTNSNKSLAYLFNPRITTQYREHFYNVTGLLKLDSQGYYHYDSTKNFAQFDKATKSFTIHDNPAPSAKGFFFPFNSYDETVNKDRFDAVINHYFGLNMVTRFVQDYGGYTTPAKRTPMVFEFSGDDDVWIFIDGVLVADLGGIHNKASVKLDFTTGTVQTSIKGTWDADYTLSDPVPMVDAFKAAYGADYDPLQKGWTTTADGKYIFADGTYHTLKFYYLERGNYESNMRIKSNLQYYPKTAITKVDQYDRPVAGAKFAVFAADGERLNNGDYSYTMLSDLKSKGGQPVTPPASPAYDANGNLLAGSGNALGELLPGESSDVLAKALYVGETNESGEMVFRDEDGLYYPLPELYDILGQYFLMREIKIPDGYRWVGGEMDMEITPPEAQSQIMVCHNAYECGVFADSILQVIAPDRLRLASKGNMTGVEHVDSEQSADGSYVNTVTHVSSDGSSNLQVNGTMFAVVLKYVGKMNHVNGRMVIDWTGYDSLEAAMADERNWAPVDGNELQGFSVEEVTPENGFVTTVIETAKKYSNRNVFAIGPSAQMQVAMSSMPGDVTTYYYMLGEQEKERTMYTVSYYWTTVKVTTQDDWNNVTDTNTFLVSSDVEDSAFDFIRVFGSSIRVPDLYNRMLVQKKDPNGELVNGAHFGLYTVEEKQNDTTSGNATTVYYETTGNRLVYLKDGQAKTNDGKTGTYTMGEDGIITVILADGEIGEITDTVVPVETAESKTQFGEDGTAQFRRLNVGTYILREIKAPAGYALSPAEVMALVTKNAIYANAGVANDGVVVGRGPGFIVASVERFASLGEIDNTLSWITMKLRVTEPSTSFQLSTKLQDDSKYFPSNEDPDEVYLQYSPTSLTGDLVFNYVVNADRYKKLGYSDEQILAIRRRMFADVGWSYNELRQDTQYGMTAKHGLANYRDLGDKDLTRLFSRSVYVQITDQPEPGNLEISKTVEGQPEGTTAPSFEFQVQLANAALQKLEDTFSYTVYATTDTGHENPLRTGFIASGGTLTLTDQEVAVIHKLPKGTHYTVTEVLNLRYDTIAIRDQGKPAIEDAGEQSFGNVVSGTLYWRAVEEVQGDHISTWVDHTSTVAYTNTYIHDLQIVKADGTDQSKLLSGAEFTLTKTIEGTKLKYYSMEQQAWVDDYTVITTDRAGRILLNSTLLREGGPFTLTEVTAPAGYQKLSAPILIELTYRQIDLNREYYFAASSHSESASFAISDDGLTLMVYNTSGHELPATGGMGTAGFYAAGAALLFISGLGAMLNGKRKKRYEK